MPRPEARHSARTRPSSRAIAAPSAIFRPYWVTSQPGQELGKPPGHVVVRPRAAAGGCVAVAVDLAAADRHGQEGDAASQQHRPRGHLRRALGDEAPGDLPHWPDRVGADGELANRGVDTVGADDQVVAAGAAVVELDGYGAVLLAEPLQRHTHPDRHGIAMECQDLVQVGAVQGEADAANYPLSAE